MANLVGAGSMVETHCCDEGVPLVSDGFGGGRCGGCPPAQGRAEGPTAKRQVESREQTAALASFKLAAAA